MTHPIQVDFESSMLEKLQHPITQNPELSRELAEVAKNQLARSKEELDKTTTI